MPSNIAHTQVDGENPALFFNVSSNGAAIDLYRKQLEVRTSVPQDGILLREGGTDQWIQQVKYQMEGHKVKDNITNY